MGKQNPDLISKTSGRFEAGVSGNPNGRPPGIVDKRTEARNLLYPHAEALINKAIELALFGDIQALRLCIERLIPRAKNETVNLLIGDISLTKASNLPLIVEKILLSVKEQQMTPEQAKSLCDVVEMQRKFIESSELEDRIASIERTISTRGENHATNLKQ